MACGTPSHSRLYGRPETREATFWRNRHAENAPYLHLRAFAVSQIKPDILLYESSIGPISFCNPVGGVNIANILEFGLLSERVDTFLVGVSKSRVKRTSGVGYAPCRFTDVVYVHV